MPIFRKSGISAESPCGPVLAQIISIVRQFADQYNRQIDDPALAFTIEEHEVAATKQRRTLISNNYFILSFRVERSWVKAHLFRTRDLLTALKQETPLNLKMALNVVQRKGQTEIRLDNATVVGDELPLMVLSLFEDLVRRSQNAAQLNQVPTLALDGRSIATAVRNLIHERNNLLNELLNQNEQIHNNMAREIHDQVISDLLLLKQFLTARQADERETELVEDAVAALRDICSGLSTRDLKDWGLMPCLKELIKKTRRKTDIEIVFQAEGKIPDFPVEVAVQIFRIIQEAMNNSLKHADPKRVEVSLQQEGTRCTISIADDGRGLSERRKTDGTGMHIMNERATMIATTIPCELTITGASPMGTQVCLQINTADLP